MRMYYDVVDAKCAQFFSNYEKFSGVEFNIAENERRIIGFYYLSLMHLHDLNYSECAQSIIDCNYCVKIEKKGNEDLGIDAVYIDEDERKIYLYNYKYELSYSPDSKFSGNAPFNSIKFFIVLNALLSEGKQTRDFSKLSSKTRSFMKEIIDIYDGSEPYETVLVLVSNCTSKITEKSINIEEIRRYLNVNEVVQISLEDIYGYLLKETETIDSTFLIPEIELLEYKENARTTSSVFVAILPLHDFVRITCDSVAKRNSPGHQFEGYNDFNLNLFSLFENVRG